MKRLFENTEDDYLSDTWLPVELWEWIFHMMLLATYLHAYADDAIGIYRKCILQEDASTFLYQTMIVRRIVERKDDWLYRMSFKLGEHYHFIHDENTCPNIHPIIGKYGYLLEMYCNNGYNSAHPSVSCFFEPPLMLYKCCYHYERMTYLTLAVDGRMNEDDLTDSELEEYSEDEKQDLINSILYPNNDYKDEIIEKLVYHYKYAVALKRV